MWEPRRLTTIWASTACYRDSFTFTCLFNDAVSSSDYIVTNSRIMVDNGLARIWMKVSAACSGVPPPIFAWDWGKLRKFSRQPLTWLKFEPCTFGIGVRSAIAGAKLQDLCVSHEIDSDFLPQTALTGWSSVYTEVGSEILNSVQMIFVLLKVSLLSCTFCYLSVQNGTQLKICIFILIRRRVGSVDKATGYELADHSSIHRRSKRFFSISQRPDLLWVHPGTYPVGTRE
jgi:hypothetical protein